MSPDEEAELEALRAEEDLRRLRAARQLRADNQVVRDELARARRARMEPGYKGSKGVPSRAVVLAYRAALREVAPNKAGYKSIAAALEADGWACSESTVRRRLAERQG